MGTCYKRFKVKIVAVGNLKNLDMKYCGKMDFGRNVGESCHMNLNARESTF